MHGREIIYHIRIPCRVYGLEPNSHGMAIIDMEKERLGVLEDKARHIVQSTEVVEGYKKLLLKQRDIMNGLAAKVKDKDDEIGTLHEELEAYNYHQQKLEDVLDRRTEQLISFRKAAMELSRETLSSNTSLSQLLSVLGDQGVKETSGSSAEGSSSRSRQRNEDSSFETQSAGDASQMTNAALKHRLSALAIENEQLKVSKSLLAVKLWNVNFIVVECL